MTTPECPSCGGQLPEEAVRFCTGCGYNLEQRDALAPLPAPNAYRDVPAAPAYREGGGRAPSSDAWYRPEPGQAPPAVRRRSRSGPILAVIVVLAILGAGGWLLLGRGHSPAPGPPTGNAGAAANAGKTSAAKASARTASPAGPQSGAEAAQLARLAGLLRQSHAARGRVVRATQGVGGCTMTPAAGMDLMRQSIRQRQQVVAALASAPVSAIPGGQSVAADLQQVLRYSVSADRGFIGWMQQIQARGKCPVNVRRSVPYQAGLAASRQADQAKAAFLASWNPLAARFSEPTYNAKRI